MPSPTTLTQKLIARASARNVVAVGESVQARFDLALLDDAAVLRLLPLLAAKPRRVAEASRVVMALDRFGAEHDVVSREKVERVRHWAATEGIDRLLDGHGIGHVVAPQAGWIRPGMLCIGGDPRMSTAGALGAYALALDPTTLIDALATGELRVEVPGTLFMRWTGRLPLGVSAKDMVLSMVERFGAKGARDRAIEFCGEAVAALSMAERMTLTNMSGNLGAVSGLIAPDATTRGWLEAVGADIDELGLQRWTSDEDAPGVRHHLDASTLVPQVALPAESAQVRDVTELASTRVDIAYLGACTGAKLDDLRAAARVLAGYRVAPGVRLLIAPASAQDRFAAEREGILRRLVEAGATLLPASCGACAGLGGHIPEGAQVVSSTACNRAGRMGAATAQIFLASPYTVAASALRGRISDAREVLS